MAPILVSPHGCDVIYHAGNKLLRSPFRGESWEDARRLAAKNGDDDTKWPDVAFWLLQKSQRSVYEDPVVKYGTDFRSVLRWEPMPADPEPQPVAFKDDGMYLITGGLGGLGVLFAEEILKRSSTGRVILTGRSALSAAQQSRLEQFNGEVSYRQLDVTDLSQVKAVIADVQRECGQLNGIVHSAGRIADNFILKKSAAEFREVLQPKVSGTANLDEASRGIELDFLVLFSSVAGALGNVGQADYATANGFLDQYAAYRNERVSRGERSGRTVSINWPLWLDGGMKIDAASQAMLERTTGMRAMQTATGLQAFYQSLASSNSQTLVVHMLRTQKIPFIQSTAALPVMLMTFLIAAVGIYLPFSGVGAMVGLQPLPWEYFPWLVGTLLAYCLVAQGMKMLYIRRFGQWF